MISNNQLVEKSDRRKKMPIINIESAKMSKDRNLSQWINEKNQRNTGNPPESITILIKEIDHDHVGVGGVLLCNMSSS